MTVCSTAVRGGPLRGMAPCPLLNRACGFIGSSPSIFTYGTAMSGCGRRRGSSRMTPGCRPACRGPTSSRGAADGTLNACGGHIRCCRACDSRWAAGSGAGCPATQRCWPASPPTGVSMSTTVTSSLVDGYWAWPASLTLITRRAKSAKLLRSRTLWRLYVEDSLLERLPQDLKDMAAALGPCSLEVHAMVGQQHVARHRHGAPADQPHIRNGVVGRAKWVGRDQRRAVAGKAGDAVDAGSVEDFRQDHRRQNGGEPPGYHRRARPRGAEQEQIMVRTPAFASSWHLHPSIIVTLATKGSG